MKGIEYWRERRGWSLLELAERCRVHWSTLEEIEAGKYFPRFGQIEKIAEALGVRPYDLFQAQAVAEDSPDWDVKK